MALNLSNQIYKTSIQDGSGVKYDKFEYIYLLLK
jgi:hypothetical protein